MVLYTDTLHTANCYVQLCKLTGSANRTPGVLHEEVTNLIQQAGIEAGVLSGQGAASQIFTPYICRVVWVCNHPYLPNLIPISYTALGALDLVSSPC